VDRTRTSLDTPITLTVKISGRGAHVDTHGIKDFDVQSRGSSTQIQIVNGNTSESQSFQFLLIPKRAGTLTIPALPVTLHGKTRYTQPLSIQVANAGSSGRASASGEADLHVEARVSDPTPYIGQQVVYTLTLRFGVRIANAQYTPPDFTGFTAKQIGHQKSRERVISGRRYQEVVLSYLLIPTDAGAATIGSATLRCDTVSRRKRRGRDFMDPFFNDPFFSDPLFGGQQLTPHILRSKPISLTVRELPPAPNQPSFSGLVGTFSMTASIENRNIKVGDSDTLTVTVQGDGNIMDADVPKLHVPDAFRQYADTPQNDIQLRPGGYRGKKVFRVALVPVRPGRFEVSPAPLSYFDPKAERYRSITVKPISLLVNKSDNPQETPMVYSSANSGMGLPAVRKKKVGFTGRDILSIKTGLDSVKNRKGPSLVVFLGALGLPAALFFLWMGAIRLMRRDTRPAALMAQKATRALKQAAGDLAGEEAAFLSSLHRSLVYAVCSRADACGEALTYAEARSILQGAGGSPELTDLVCELMNAIDSARFGGGSLEKADRERMLAQARQLVKGVLR
jgi:hypothetical protein